MVQIIEWFRAEAACASRSKRLRACEHGANPQEGTSVQRSGGAWCPQPYIHHSHAADKLFKDAVMRDGLPEERLVIRHFALILGCSRGQVNEDGQLAGQCLINA